ncbi:DUF2799 domain-containing protein [Litorivivens sp.]|uniref:DUF2799 domain-containing protein n=1 Tax=Litorivivens sp. TaxID=2020868 RepID=UPI0035673D74
MHYRIVLPCITLLLSACASMSPEECQYADWQEVGRSDAQRGLSQDHVAQHRKSCAKAGYPIDAQQYYAGYQTGLRDYCIGVTAYNAARLGRSKPVQCEPASVRSHDFTRAYHYGLKVRDQDLKIYALQQELADLSDAIAAGEAHFHEIRATLDHAELDNHEAIALHEESKQVSHQIARDQQHFEQLEVELRTAQSHLEQMERNFQLGRY